MKGAVNETEGSFLCAESLGKFNSTAIKQRTNKVRHNLMSSAVCMLQSAASVLAVSNPKEREEDGSDSYESHLWAVPIPCQHRLVLKLCNHTHRLETGYSGSYYKAPRACPSNGISLEATITGSSTSHSGGLPAVRMLATRFD
jgi:hypothetical protein